MSKSFSKLVASGEYPKSMILWDTGWSKDAMVADSTRGIMFELGFLVDATERIADALEKANRIAEERAEREFPNFGKD
jgi:hypothetical protein